MGCSLEDNLKPMVQWWKELGMDDSQVAKTIVKFPQLMSCSLEENLKPSVQWLKELGMDDVAHSSLAAA